MSFGAPHRHLRRTDSTNARARDLALAGAPGGLVVTADEQDSGRGRQGRSWFAKPGSALLYSALLRPMVPAEHRLLPLAAPLAVCETAEGLVPGIRCEVKWPNDVWVEGRKLAGILIESRPDMEGTGWAVIGVGLNVSVADDDFPEELRETATSLLIAGGGSAAPGLGAVRVALDAALTRWTGSDDDAVLAAYRERDGLRGREISWDGGAGTVAGIDDSGHLLVDTGADRVALGAGEVHLSLG